MELVTVTKQQAELKITVDELLIVNSALNEICNGISVAEFDSRIGATREDVILLLEKIGQILDSMTIAK